MKPSILGLSVTAFLCGVTTNVFAAGYEVAIGDAVNFNASAVYYNPASLVNVPNPQINFQGTQVWDPIKFDGTIVHKTPQAFPEMINNFFGPAAAQAIPNAYTLSGSAYSNENFLLPQFFISTPINPNLSVGIGGLYTFYGPQGFDDDSIVRYVSTDFLIQTYDITPAIAYKFNNQWAVGAGLDFSRAYINFQYMTGYPQLSAQNLNFSPSIPPVVSNIITGILSPFASDSATDLTGRDWGYGAHVGIQYTPAPGTFIGLTYHTAIIHHLTGSSEFSGPMGSASNNDFAIDLTSPPLTVLTINQFFSRQFGIAATAEFAQWSYVRQFYLKNVIVGVNPTQTGSFNSQLDFSNAWRFSLTPTYIVNDKLSIFGIGQYLGDPSNSKFISAVSAQSPGYVLGAGANYIFNKNLSANLSYSHTFFKDVPVNMSGPSVQNDQFGSIKQHADSISFGFTWNFV
jgi:long-chain fatty acid transport protein